MMDAESSQLSLRDLKEIMLSLNTAKEECVNEPLRIFLANNWRCADWNEIAAFHCILLNVLCQSSKPLPLLGQSFLKLYKDVLQEDLRMYHELTESSLVKKLLNLRMKTFDVKSGKETNLINFILILVKQEHARADLKPVIGWLIETLVTDLSRESMYLEVGDEMMKMLTEICRELLVGSYSGLLTWTENIQLKTVCTKYFSFAGKLLPTPNRVL